MCSANLFLLVLILLRPPSPSKVFDRRPFERERTIISHLFATNYRNIVMATRKNEASKYGEELLGCLRGMKNDFEFGYRLSLMVDRMNCRHTYMNINGLSYGDHYIPSIRLNYLRTGRWTAKTVFSLI